jgi:hypothetical protein
VVAASHDAGSWVGNDTQHLTRRSLVGSPSLAVHRQSRSTLLPSRQRAGRAILGHRSTHSIFHLVCSCRVLWTAEAELQGGFGTGGMGSNLEHVARARFLLTSTPHCHMLLDRERYSFILGLHEALVRVCEALVPDGSSNRD